MMTRSTLMDRLQMHVEKADWLAAIEVREQLFGMEPDPLIRVRIGDHKLKLGKQAEAVQEYFDAGKMFAGQGMLRKARAQYMLVLRLEPAHAKAAAELRIVHTIIMKQDRWLHALQEMEGVAICGYAWQPPYASAASNDILHAASVSRVSVVC